MKKFLLTIFTLFLITVSFAHAEECPEGPWYEQTPCQFNKKVKNISNPDEIFGERYTYAQINWIINSLAIVISPQDPEKFIKDSINLINKARTGQLIKSQEYSSLGVPGYLLGSISEIYTNPLSSGVNEVKNLASRIFDYSAGVTPAYAQGDGFNSLSAVQTLWKATRNTAYLVMVILLISSGFLIMFRVKINPQTVISLQTMIPKLIITMLLVTFSFAIAGLVIDLIYVFITFFIALLQFSGVISPGNIGETIKLFTTTHGEWIIGYFLIPWLAVIALGAVVAFLPGVITTVIGSLMALISVIVAIFLLWQLIKIWWMLLKSYITLILLIAVGPLQIMLDLIPGQSGFGSWIRNIIANASVFVVVPVMFLLNMLFWKPFFGLSTIPQIGQVFNESINPLGYVDTAIGISTALPNLPFVNGSGLILNLAVGYVILTLTPKVAEMIRDALKIPAFKYGAAGSLKETVIQPIENITRATVAVSKFSTEAWPKIRNAIVVEDKDPRITEDG